ncbi:hypothetical protein SAMN06269173_10686 [Hymenobacter mucosus]|uniref:Uncharacterized protein n=1 Tax=Hymenobacter mucosus TaxID=1411120 RepID=A0A238YTI2_9BACT|nr:hypothetical protein SAMN06269173_10686 [Hymenobacter mucosus]
MPPSYRHTSVSYRNYVRNRLRAATGSGKVFLTPDIFNLLISRSQQALAEAANTVAPLAERPAIVSFRLGDFLLGDVECPLLYGDPTIRY